MTKTERQKLKAKFKKALKDIGLTLKDFSDITGTPLDTVSNWGAPSKPSVPTACAFSWVKQRKLLIEISKELIKAHRPFEKVRSSAPACDCDVCNHARQIIYKIIPKA